MMTSDFEIRPFVSADAEAILTLWSQTHNTVCPASLLDTMCRKAIQRDDLFLVATDQAKPIATVMAGHDGGRGWIHTLVVANPDQRQDVARMMLARAESALASQGCDHITALIRNETRDSILQIIAEAGYASGDFTSLHKSLGRQPQEIFDPVPSIHVDDQFHLGQVTWEDQARYLECFNATHLFQEMMGTVPSPYLSIDFDIFMTRVALESLAVAGQRRRSWAIRNTEDQVIGGLGLFDMQVRERAEVGYWLAKPYWGQGIMTRAVSKLCEFAFAEYDLQRITARCFAKNAASARVLTKAGFALEGTLRKDYFREGVPHDVMWFGLLQ